jgi:hypothetical protein
MLEGEILLCYNWLTTWKAVNWGPTRREDNTYLLRGVVLRMWTGLTKDHSQSVALVLGVLNHRVLLSETQVETVTSNVLFWQELLWHSILLAEKSRNTIIKDNYVASIGRHAEELTFSVTGCDFLSDIITIFPVKMTEQEPWINEYGYMSLDIFMQQPVQIEGHRFGTDTLLPILRTIWKQQVLLIDTNLKYWWKITIVDIDNIVRCRLF